MPGSASVASAASGALAQWWRPFVAEVVATALLVLLGVGSIVPKVDAGGQLLAPPLTHPALAFAFLVVALAVAFGPVSGAHMNPAVTLAALLYGQLAPAPAALYFVAQMIGGVAGFAALALVSPAEAMDNACGCTAPSGGVSAAAAMLVELVLTATLALACCGAWAAHDDARPDHSVPLKLGLTVGGLVYAGGHLTGASLNPARSFGPALYHKFWRDHWVYWVGPLLGAAVAALLHRFVLSPPAPRTPPPRAEELPLHDKPDR